MKIDAKTIEQLRTKCKESLFFFARAVLGFSDLTKHIHRPICQELQDYKKNTRVLIVLPRDWFKSTMGSIAYAIWRSLSDPNIRILVTQNSFSNACKKLQAIKQIFEGNELFKTLFPEIMPTSKSTWSKECLTLNRTAAHPEGTFEAAGTGTATTSRHYDLIIEDDTVSPEKDALTGLMLSPTQLEIEKAIGWHRLAHPMLLHPKYSQIVVIGTRWAERDLLGWIIENCPEYKFITRAVREDKNGNARDASEGGEPIWERFDNDVLEQLERELGPYMFACLMMNRPTDAVNQVFLRDWIRYYQTLPRGTVYCTSVDPAAADKEESSDPDYNVVLTTGVSPSTGEIFVVHYTRDRMSPGALVNAIIDHCRTYKPLVTKVESIAYQRTLNYWIRKRQSETNVMFRIEELKGLKGSKVDRIRGLQPYFAADRIAIRTNMPELERELIAFPKGAHDDIIDALSMHVDFWYEVMESYTREQEVIEIDSPFSGQAVIDQLMGRPRALSQYPADIGLMRERFVGFQRRGYSYGT